MNTLQARRGFTLVELLVVLTIIGILVAVLMPVFLQAREKARQNQCLSNLHQISIALDMYQDDNGGWLPKDLGYYIPNPPAAQAQGDQSESDTGPPDDLWPYDGHNPQIYHCPDDSSTCPQTSECFQSDYGYRPATLLYFQQQYHRPQQLLRPSPSSVLVWDPNHFQYNTAYPYLILRANGAVSAVPSSRVTDWYYMPNGQLVRYRGIGRPPSLIPEDPVPVFPDEPWPPQFEK